ncbi:extracellular catalytic domain type 2 short-chain-length polyhydroxyalkanoate depolymerase [Pseudoduganella sp. RAF53_2]|uniref:extracellular catalytic domain type 2 short-chain-length polyhydroxyalkanoate depolymerase n=1 Tax=unclassified Pseudoduganella TaxID=2637179 RepID=UPI003F990DE6
MSRLLMMRVAFALAMLMSPLFALSQVVSLPSLKASQLSVSGLSSGAFMAVQFDVAFSASVIGAGVVAGGPYYCAEGQVGRATSVCSCTGLGQCQVSPGGTGVADLIATTSQNASSGRIDPTARLASHRIWMFSGSADSLVPQAVMGDLESYYRNYITSGQISFKKDLKAQHAMPTDFYGNNCTTLGSPYINNCNYDAAGALLQWIYGSLTPKTSNTPAGTFIQFDQSEFLSNPASHGMAATGYLYIPPGCEGDAASCRLHVVFHGCKQDPANIGDTYVRNAGYNGWADANRIVILYPQATTTPLNPNACWDWWAYDDSNYAIQSGRQMQAVKRMTDRLTGQGGATPPSPPPQPGECFTATNYEHVKAGRAYDRFFFAYALGSDQRMGLDNTFSRTTLKRTAPNYYEIGSCP